jgi:hypothetical protein
VRDWYIFLHQPKLITYRSYWALLQIFKYFS